MIGLNARSLKFSHSKSSSERKVSNTVRCVLEKLNARDGSDVKELAVRFLLQVKIFLGAKQSIHIA